MFRLESESRMPWSASLLVMCMAAFSLALLTGCGNNSPQIELNEILASNHCGLVASDGNLYDWIEVKNTSDHDANLKDYTLRVEKIVSPQKTKGDAGDDAESSKPDEDNDGSKKKGGPKTWQFPDRVLKPGECVIVYASKKDESTADELHASMKLSAQGGKVELLRGDEVVSSVEYGELEDDQCFRRDDNGQWEVSYDQTPGEDNTGANYEKFCSQVEKQRTGPLRLWEYHSRGYKKGNAWVEIKNVSEAPVSLNDYCLTTSAKKPGSWAFPDVELQPGEFYVVDCQRDGFKVSGNKGVMLTKGGKFVDGIRGGAPSGTTTGRVMGKDGMFYFSTPTRGAENTTQAFRTVAPEPTFNEAPGIVGEKKNFKLTINTHGYTVRYTTDGSKPTAESPVYGSSVILESTAMVRAYCEGDSTAMPSRTVSSTYILGEDPHTMPVVNITVDKDDLYDHHRGIYAEGPNPGSEYPHKGANYWKGWWKRAHVELFDSVGGFSEDCELAIFGGFSRGMAKKSFKVRFKNNDDHPSITCDLFADGQVDKYRKFVLRSGSQDAIGTMVRDEFFTSLMSEQCPELLIQKYRPVALYVNGEYFGLYYIREKIDKHFVARKLHVKTDSVTIMMSGLYCDEGPKKPYADFMNYVRTHDLRKSECYDYVADHFDLQGLADYKLGQIYSLNTDIGNVRFVRSADPKGDRKWHVVYYDLDATWDNYRSPAFYLRPGTGSVAHAVNDLTAKLLENPRFRTLFLERASVLLHKTFTPKNTTALFDKIIAAIKPEMGRNCERWPQLLKYERWEQKVEKFRSRFATRSSDMLKDLRAELAVTPEEDKRYFAGL